MCVCPVYIQGRLLSLSLYNCCIMLPSTGQKHDEQPIYRIIRNSGNEEVCIHACTAVAATDSQPRNIQIKVIMK